MSKPRVIYFDFRGRGEIVRLAFAAGGVEFEDYRVQFQDLPDLNAKGVCPFGQLPVVEIPGRGYIGQSAAEARFAAKMGNIYPTDDFDAAVVDMILTSAQELLDKKAQIYVTKDEKIKEEKQKEYTEKILPKYLENFQNQLKKNKDGKGFFVGDKISLADVALFNFTNGLARGKLETPDQLSSYPLIAEHYNRVMNDPKLLAYLKSRKQTDL